MTAISQKSTLTCAHSELSEVVMGACGAAGGRAGLAIAVVLSVLTFVPPPASAASAISPAVLGAYAKPRRGETEHSAVERLEGQIGRKLAAVRVYSLWNDAFPTTYHTWLRDSGHTPVLSVKAKRSDGTTVAWTSIANAAPGSARQNEIVAWARRVRDFGAPVYFTFNHEPEASSNSALGTATDYVAAWRKVVAVFRAEGATNARFLWITTSHAFRVGPADSRYGPKWYPGDDVVDAIGADAYNWYNCRDGVDTPWYSLQFLLEKWRLFASQHAGKPLWVVEFASAEDPAAPGRKGQWNSDARALFKSPAYERLAGVLYFDSEHKPDARCRWYADTSASSLSALAAMAADPAFSGRVTG